MKLPEDWAAVLQEETRQLYYKELQDFVTTQYSTTSCYPPIDLVYAAFDWCSFEKTQVVILGQDPYHGFGQANGLCFSVYDGVKFPPSLVNIFKEIERDLELPLPISGNLERWASQGVLLLNTTLTVREGLPASHQNQGWGQFTDAVIRVISEQKKDVVFLLWGGHAQKKGKIIDAKNHLVLTSGHPSPLSANRGYWFGNKHFSQVNTFLQQKNKVAIDW